MEKMHHFYALLLFSLSPHENPSDQLTQGANS
jgi:hypothetical protein